VNGSATPDYPVESLVVDALTGKAGGQLLGALAERQALGTAVKVEGKAADAPVATQTEAPKKAAPGQDYATMYGEKVPPQKQGDLYHGTNRTTLGLGDMSLEDAAAHIKANGLQARGVNIELSDHAAGVPDTAYRGTTTMQSSPYRDAGAVLWAEVDGLVIEIKNVKGYDLNALRETSSKGGGLSGYAQGKALGGEVEISIPAEVRPENISRVGKVVIEDETGIKKVEWFTDLPSVKSPAPKPPAPSNSSTQAQGDGAKR
jgi:hypothetical protein